MPAPQKITSEQRPRTFTSLACLGEDQARNIQNYTLHSYCKNQPSPLLLGHGCVTRPLSLSALRSDVFLGIDLNRGSQASSRLPGSCYPSIYLGHFLQPAYPGLQLTPLEHGWHPRLERSSAEWCSRRSAAS